LCSQSQRKLLCEQQASTALLDGQSLLSDSEEHDIQVFAWSAGPSLQYQRLGDANASHDQSRGGYLSSSSQRERITGGSRPSLRRLRQFCIRLAIVILSTISLASARPFIPHNALPPLASVVLVPDSTKPQQFSGPQTWVTIACFFMVLAGFAWATCVFLRPETLRYSFELLGLLSLTVSVAWTAILYSVDINDNRRYLALGCWSIFIIAFTAESYHHVQHWPQYTFAGVPTFLTALHLTLFLVNQHTSPEEVQIWGLRQFYENAPLAFTLWTMLLCWIYHRPAVGDPSGGEDGDNGDPGDSHAPGEGPAASIPLGDWAEVV
jgi:hypothetical protein